MIVTLIGYRGCGKSSVGPLLAAQLRCPCIDCDDELERRAGRTIPEIFATDGEPEFRRLETELLAEILAGPDAVVSAGGGAILAEENCRNMKDAGPVVWLNAPVEVLAARIAGDEQAGARRPSLTGQSAVAEVAGVLNQRLPLYAAAATMTVDSSEASPAQIAEIIATRLTTETAEPAHDQP